MRAQLIPVDGSPPIDILKDLTVVGRKEGCDLCIHHKSISKMHCVIVKAEGLLLLRDLGSTNGTRVNGQRVRRAILLPNDQLSIASHKYRVHLGPDEPSVVAVEHTQHLEPVEVAGLIRQQERKTPVSDSGHLPAAPLKPNVLPDIYPDHPSKQT